MSHQNSERKRHRPETWNAYASAGRRNKVREMYLKREKNRNLVAMSRGELDA